MNREELKELLSKGFAGMDFNYGKRKLQLFLSDDVTIEFDVTDNLDISMDKPREYAVEYAVSRLLEIVMEK